MPEIQVGHLAALETQRELDLVAFLEELAGVVDLDHQIVVADFRPQAQLLVFAVMCVAFVLPLLLLVFEFAVIHDSANRRLFLRRDFDQV